MLPGLGVADAGPSWLTAFAAVLGVEITAVAGCASCRGVVRKQVPEWDPWVPRDRNHGVVYFKCWLVLPHDIKMMKELEGSCFDFWFFNNLRLNHCVAGASTRWALVAGSFGALWNSERRTSACFLRMCIYISWEGWTQGSHQTMGDQLCRTCFGSLHVDAKLFGT